MNQLTYSLIFLFFCSAMLAQEKTNSTNQKNGAEKITGHYIGELFGGGIVVAVWKDGTVEHGLIASLADLGKKLRWSNNLETSVGTSAQSLSDGAANTKAIITQPDDSTSAAFLCHNFKGGGYNDWYLPAISQLTHLHKAFDKVYQLLGKQSFSFGDYWSSTEKSDYQAFTADLTTDTQSPARKDVRCAVRAVRSF